MQALTLLALGALAGSSIAAPNVNAAAVTFDAPVPAATNSCDSLQNPSNVTCQRVTFDSSGTQLVGYLFSPTKAPAAKVPSVVIAHGLGGIQTSRIMPFAQQFAAQGYHAMTFDYRYWGQSAGTPRNIIEVKSQEDDYRAAKTFIKTVSGADDRVVYWGTSLSGGHVLQLGALNDDDVAAIIAQCPHVNGPYTVSLLPPASLPGLIAAGITDDFNAFAGLPRLYVPTANRTGEFGALTQTGAYEGYQFVQPNPPAPGNRFPASFVTELPFFSPDVVAPLGRAPTFIGVGSTDNIVGFMPQTALAKEMGAEFHSYNGGHFSVYPGADQYAAILADQIAFLKKNVPIN